MLIENYSGLELHEIAIKLLEKHKSAENIDYKIKIIESGNHDGTDTRCYQIGIRHVQKEPEMLLSWGRLRIARPSAKNDYKAMNAVYLKQLLAPLGQPKMEFQKALAYEREENGKKEHLQIWISDERYPW